MSSVSTAHKHGGDWARYFDESSGYYYYYNHRTGQSVWEELQPFAFKLLIDLLFYSATNGHRRLWLVLVE